MNQYGYSYDHHPALKYPSNGGDPRPEVLSMMLTEMEINGAQQSPNWKTIREDIPGRKDTYRLQQNHEQVRRRCS